MLLFCQCPLQVSIWLYVSSLAVLQFLVFILLNTFREFVFNSLILALYARGLALPSSFASFPLSFCVILFSGVKYVMHYIMDSSCSQDCLRVTDINLVSLIAVCLMRQGHLAREFFSVL